jgi:Rrf2 family protein
MHITLEADYAVRIVHALAQSGKRLDAKTISEMTGVTLRFSLKILRKLVAAGIVKSFKGTQGGYEIGKPAEEIALGEVIETIEGRYTLNRCVTGEYALYSQQYAGFCGMNLFVGSHTNTEILGVKSMAERLTCGGRIELIRIREPND